MKGKFWKSRGNRIVSCIMAFCTVISVCGCSKESGEPDGVQSESEVKESYTFIYDLNYEGATNTTRTIGAGKKASSYNPSRLGYTFEGWYSDINCTTLYDFTKSVNKDTTIYALWTDNSTITYYDVTFDYGDGLVRVEKCRADRAVPYYAVMESQRFGYDIIGWYKDPAFEQAFEIGVTPVTQTMTLYAKYELVDGMAFTQDGDFDFNNVEITISFRDTHDTVEKAWVENLLTEFNEIYEDRISISTVSSTENATLIYNTTSELNTKYNNYYSMEDVLAMVGKDFDKNEYYENWINDCYVDGELYSMPIAAFVPAIGYNRQLMKTYNNGALPTDHASFMELLQRVYEGEKGKKDWQSVVSMSLSLDMKEVVANNFYLQNNLPLYSVGEEGRLYNQWMQDDAVKTRALNATNWFRNMFTMQNSMGKIKGYAWSTGKSAVDWTYVGSGKSFIGIMGWPNLNNHFGWRVNQTEKKLWTETVGAMPISYFFATEGDEESARRIYVQNFSLAIPKLVESSAVKVAAAAVFADFASKYCENSCESYLYPANKVAQYNAFNNLNRHWSVDYLLAEIGNPIDFYTYPGVSYQQKVISSVQSTFLMKDICWLDDTATEETVLKTIQSLCDNINKEAGVK